MLCFDIIIQNCRYSKVYKWSYVIGDIILINCPEQNITIFWHWEHELPVTVLNIFKELHDSNLQQVQFWSKKRKICSSFELVLGDLAVRLIDSFTNLHTNKGACIRKPKGQDQIIFIRFIKLFVQLQKNITRF